MILARNGGLLVVFSMLLSAFSGERWARTRHLETPEDYGVMDRTNDYYAERRVPRRFIEPWNDVSLKNEIPLPDRIVGEREGALSVPKPIRHPRLSIEHRKFAVNPGYMSYYNPELGHIEDEIEERKMGETRSNPARVEGDENDDVQEGVSDTEKAKAGEIFEQVEKANAGGDKTPFGDPHGDHNKLFLDSYKWPEDERSNDVVFTACVAAGSTFMCFVIIFAGVCYMRANKKAKAAEDVEYPAYGVTGTTIKETSPTFGGDRKLAQSAQMYHYQHQKQQMIAFNSHQNGTNSKGLASDDDSDDGEEGDYTVYECPGLAPTGEMEVRNPMFRDDQMAPNSLKK